MTDSLTDSDIDRIYGRIQEQINLSKITTKKQFFKAIKDNPKTRKWNESLNDFFWDIHTKSEKVIEVVPEIERIPAIPRERLTPIEKRKETIKEKENLIDVKGSYKQKGYKRSKGRRWVEEELKFVQRLRKDGLTHKQIANQLKRTSSSISTKLSRIK